VKNICINLIDRFNLCHKIYFICLTIADDIQKYILSVEIIDIILKRGENVFIS